MITLLRRIYGRMRTDLVRSRIFDRKVRVRPLRASSMSAHEQAVYAQACRNVERMIPMNGGRS